MTKAIQTFEDAVDQLSHLPDLHSPRPVFSLSPLEYHFMETADKHGVIDELIARNLEGEYDEQ